MSGGSFNYLCHKESLSDLSETLYDLEDMRECLIKYGYDDIAKDTQRLIEYIKSAKVRVETLAEMLRDVFHAVEWYENADIGMDSMIRELEKYRNGGKE